MSNEELGYLPPLRKDGTPVAFWYDPDHPGHIIHNPNDGDDCYAICVGHGYQENKAWR
ncbi:MAG TPA: hypothetical protein VHL57_02375 [Flavobacteriales bacterium]|nr:hypothetical protein [Flavobacteriales bacterium]